MRLLNREAVERVARIYRTNADASAALGVTTRSFARACREHGIETPYVRQRRRAARPVGFHPGNQGQATSEARQA